MWEPQANGLVPEGQGTEALTSGEVIVWILRLVLPCILFWISFGPRLRLPWYRCHSREKLLAYRDAVAAAQLQAPEALASLMLVDQYSAPKLFVSQDRAERQGRKGDRLGAVGDKGDRAAVAASAAADRAPRGITSGGPGGGTSGGASTDDSLTAEPRQEEPPAPVPSPSDTVSAMHLASVVNFVAFSRREQQRFFLPGDGFMPPPPPKPGGSKPLGVSRGRGSGPASRSALEPSPAEDLLAAAGPLVTTAAVERANAEAQMVLHGAMKLGGGCGPLVARALHAQLQESSVGIAAATWELLAEACLEAKELQPASDFLMQMEAIGHTPSSELLDGIMELYLEHRRATEAKEAASSAAAAAASTLSVRVPPPPPPLPMVEEDCWRAPMPSKGLRPDSAPFEPSMPQGPTVAPAAPSGSTGPLVTAWEDCWQGPVGPQALLPERAAFEPSMPQATATTAAAASGGAGPLAAAWKAAAAVPARGSFGSETLAAVGGGTGAAPTASAVRSGDGGPDSWSRPTNWQRLPAFSVPDEFSKEPVSTQNDMEKEQDGQASVTTTEPAAADSERCKRDVAALPLDLLVPEWSNEGWDLPQLNETSYTDYMGDGLPSRGWELPVDGPNYPDYVDDGWGTGCSDPAAAAT